MSRALTLIEVLAVLVILALVASVATVGLASTADDAHLRDAALGLRNLDARARLWAQSLGAVEISFSAARDSGDVVMRAAATGERLAGVNLPAGLLATIQTADGAHAVYFDRLGRSPDYSVTLESDRARRSWTVLGLTGLVLEGSP